MYKNIFAQKPQTARWNWCSDISAVAILDPIAVAPFKLRASQELLRMEVAVDCDSTWFGVTHSTQPHTRPSCVNVRDGRIADHYEHVGDVETKTGLIFMGDGDELQRKCFHSQIPHRDAYEEILSASARKVPGAFTHVTHVSQLDLEQEFKWVTTIAPIGCAPIGVVFHAKYGPGKYKVICGFIGTEITSVGVVDF